MRAAASAAHANAHACKYSLHKGMESMRFISSMAPRVQKNSATVS